MELINQEIEILRQLKDKGFAVVIITPEELKGANADDVEDRLIELSWDIIFDLDLSDDKVEKGGC
jgi:hypothetical protein